MKTTVRLNMDLDIDYQYHGVDIVVEEVEYVYAGEPTDWASLDGFKNEDGESLEEYLALTCHDLLVKKIKRQDKIERVEAFLGNRGNA